MINKDNTMQGRAGRYILQSSGYRAFIPAPLPPEPPVDLSRSLRVLLSEADYALGRLDGAILTLPNWLDITPAGANQLVNRLLDLGILSEITGYARNRRFRFEPYMRLFEDSEGEKT